MTSSNPGVSNDIYIYIYIYIYRERERERERENRKIEVTEEIKYENLTVYEYIFTNP